MKRTALVLVSALLIGVFLLSPASAVNSGEANIGAINESKTITIEGPYVPWEKPLGSAADTTDGVFTVEYFSDTPLITLEIEVVDSPENVAYEVGKKTVVTDGALIYVMYCEMDISRGLFSNVTKYVDVYDVTQPLIWYGTIKLNGSGVYDGTYVAISSYGATVSSKPNYSNLTITSSGLGTNPAPSVILRAYFSVTRDNGATQSSNVGLIFFCDGSTF
jgi:hypothetical protein